MVGKGHLTGAGWGKSFNIPIVLVKGKKKKIMARLLAVQNEQAWGLPVLAVATGREQCVHEEQGGGVETELLLDSLYWPSGEVNAGKILISALLDREVPLHCGT